MSTIVYFLLTYHLAGAPLCVAFVLFCLDWSIFPFCFVFLIHWIRIHPSIYIFSLDNLPRSFSIVIYCVIPASMADVSPIDMVEISFTGMVNLRSSSMASCLASL